MDPSIPQGRPASRLAPTQRSAGRRAAHRARRPEGAWRHKSRDLPAPRLHGHAGTLTQLPILTLPGDDIGHPIPDLTGYITEGQIVLDRQLDRVGIYPPINVLPSLSRLMDYGTGEGFTDADHPALASQLFAAYASARRVRVLASVMGHEGLSDMDRDYLEFGDRFEQHLISQEQSRTLEESMAAGWETLRILKDSELTRLSNEQIERNVRKRGPHA